MGDTRRNFRTYGSLAMGHADNARSSRAVIVPFKRTGHSVAPASLRDRFNSILLSSEMYCSLLLEDVRGCAYGKLTRRQAAFLGSSATLFGIVCVFLGA